MAVKLEAPLKEGYLLIPPQGLKKVKHKFCFILLFLLSFYELL